MDILTGAPLSRGAAHQATPMERSLLGRSLRARMSPVVMLVPTPAAESLCAGLGVPLIDLLRPHCEFRNLNLPVRPAGEHSYRLHDFRLRLYYASDVRPPSVEASEEYLSRLVTESAQAAEDELAGADPSEVSSILAMANNEGPESWFQRFSAEFTRTLCFSEHEAIDQPVACIFVASTAEPTPVGTLQDLALSSASLPALFKEGHADPGDLIKHFVLLRPQGGHAQESPEDSARVDALVDGLHSVVGPSNARLLNIPLPSPAEGEGAEADEGKERDGQREAVLRGTKDQVVELLTELTVKKIIPGLERKVRDLNQQVSASRRGLRNQIKNLWFGKTKEETSELPPGVYTFRSPESQLRVLADSAMMLQDFLLANENYRLLASDFRRDKAWKHYAGAQEMVGVTMFLLDMSRREMDQSMESAYSSYQRCGALGARFAMRSVLWLAGMCKARGQFRDAALTLMRASLEETGVRAAVLLEQAALCFLRADPPMVRKYGFHMVLAGNRYNLASQRRHAVRAYRYAEGVYKGKGWSFITDHCNFTLGRLSAFLGSYDMAVHFFLRLLASAHQSAAMQATFLREFLYVLHAVQQADRGGALQLPLPALSRDTLAVRFEDHRTFASPAAALVPEAVWGALEDGLVPPAAAMVVPTWLDAPSKTRAHDVVATNTCVAGETITVEVEFHNPLKIPLSISGAHLVCHHAHVHSPDQPQGGGWGKGAAKGAGPKGGEQRGKGEGAEGREGEGPIARATSTPVLSKDDASVADGGQAGARPLSAAPQHRSQSDLSGEALSVFTIDEEEDSTKPGSTPPDASTPTATDTTAGAPSAAPGAEAGGPAEAGDGVRGSAEEGPGYEAVDAEFTLLPDERARVSLSVRATREGALHIQGVQWVLGSEGRSATGEHRFDLKSGRKGKARAAGAPGGFGTAVNAFQRLGPHQRLHFLVSKAMPRLEMRVHGLPPVAHQGELHKLVLELANNSSVPLKRLKLRTSQPQSVAPGRREDLDLQLPQDLEVGRPGHTEATGGAPGGGRAAGGAPPVPGSEAGGVFSFPHDVILEAGSTLLWPLWFRPCAVTPPAAAGTPPEALHMVLYYEPIPEEEEEREGAKGGIGSINSTGSGTSGTTGKGHLSPLIPQGAKIVFRTLRALHRVEVQPSLSFSLRLSPSAGALTQYLLRLDVENLHPSEAFWLRQVSCLGGTWALGPLAPMLPSDSGGVAGEGQAGEGGGAEGDKGAELAAAGSSAYMSAAMAPPQLLPAGQGTTLFFHMQASQQSPGAGPSSGGSTDPPSGSMSTSVGLSGNHGEALLQTASGPIHSFNLRERALQADTLASPSSASGRKAGAPERGPPTKGKRPTPGGSADGTPAASPRAGPGGGAREQWPDGEPVDVVLLWEHQVGGLQVAGGGGGTGKTGGGGGRGGGGGIGGKVGEATETSGSGSVRLGSHHVCGCTAPATGSFTKAVSKGGVVAPRPGTGGLEGASRAGSARGSAGQAGEGGAPKGRSSVGVPSEGGGVPRPSTGRPLPGPQASVLGADGCVRFVLSGPAFLRHDFGQTPVCTVPLRLSVRNCSKKAAHVLVEAIDPLLALPHAPGSSGSQARMGGVPTLHQGGAQKLVYEKAGWFRLQELTAGSATGASGPGTDKVEGAAAVTTAGSGGAHKASSGGVGAQAFELGGDDVLSGPPPCGPYTWVKRTAKRISLPDPGSEAEVTLVAAVYAPGVFNFSHYRVSWVLHDQDKGPGQGLGLEPLGAPGATPAAVASYGGPFLVLVLPASDEGKAVLRE